MSRFYKVETTPAQAAELLAAGEKVFASCENCGLLAEHQVAIIYADGRVTDHANVMFQPGQFYREELL